MFTCNGKDCTVTHEYYNRDLSLGGCGYFAYVCPVHAPLFDAEQRIDRLESQRTFTKSVIRQKITRLEVEMKQLDSLDDKLLVARKDRDKLALDF